MSGRAAIGEPEAGTPCRVAVVDDDEGVLRSVCRLLRTADFDVTSFPSAEAFLASQTAFRCLVLDVQLTGQTGVELYHHLEKSGQAPPAVFITSHEEYLSSAASSDRLEWLRKPFEARDLILAIRRLVQAAEA